MEMNIGELQQNDQELQGRAHQAFEIIFSFVPTLVLKSAVLLKIPDIIASAGPNASLSLHQIAARLPSQTPNIECLSRILRYLSAKGVFVESRTNDPSDVHYALTDTTKHFYVSQNNPFSLVPFVLMHTHEVFMKPWHHFHESVLEGCQAFEKAHGKDLWAYASEDPNVNNVFSAAMASFTSMVMKQALSCYHGFKEVKTLVDVGGGTGAALTQIVKAHPHIHGINFDLPHVVATAPSIPGVEHVGGDMFESIPSADAIFMKIVLHDWDDERCKKILDNCYKALADNGRLILTEVILPERSMESSLSIGLVADMLMIAHTAGGRERSEQEWRTLLRASGFNGFKVLMLPGIPVQMMESRKTI